MYRINTRSFPSNPLDAVCPSGRQLVSIFGWGRHIFSAMWGLLFHEFKRELLHYPVSHDPTPLPQTQPLAHGCISFNAGTHSRGSGFGVSQVVSRIVRTRVGGRESSLRSPPTSGYSWRHQIFSGLHQKCFFYTCSTRAFAISHTTDASSSIVFNFLERPALTLGCGGIHAAQHTREALLVCCSQNCLPPPDHPYPCALARVCQAA